MTHTKEYLRAYRQTETYKNYRRAYQKSAYYKQWAREHKKKLGYVRTQQRYQRTPGGFLVRLYRNMKSRVTGIQTIKFHLYGGKELLDKLHFYEWARANKEFWRLYEQWVASGYVQKLTPSVNRIDSKRGYTLDNMEWLTHSQNSALTTQSKKI